MWRLGWIFGLVAFGAASPKASAADEPEAHLTTAALVARCTACHGTAASPTPGQAAVPTLAGQYEEYLFKQLRNFRDGDRPQAAMLAAAHAVPDRALRPLARHFAALSRTSARAANSAGAVLYLHGQADRNIPACIGCHGALGQDSVSEITPVVYGLPREYLVQQLRQWRGKVRANSVDGMMNLATEHLSDADIVAVAEFLGR